MGHLVFCLIHLEPTQTEMLCKCVQCDAFVSLLLSHFLFMWAREPTKAKQGWDDGKRKMLGGGSCVSAILCLTVCFWWALAQHVLVYNESRGWYTALPGILIECRAPLCLQRCWFLSALLPIVLFIRSPYWKEGSEQNSSITVHYLLILHIYAYRKDSRLFYMG